MHPSLVFGVRDTQTVTLYLLAGFSMCVVLLMLVGLAGECSVLILMASWWLSKGEVNWVKMLNQKLGLQASCLLCNVPILRYINDGKIW